MDILFHSRGFCFWWSHSWKKNLFPILASIAQSPITKSCAIAIRIHTYVFLPLADFGVFSYRKRLAPKVSSTHNLVMVSANKGQVISKGLLVSSNSTKKTNELVFYYYDEFVRSFSGRIGGPQKVISKFSDLYKMAIF